MLVLMVTDILVGGFTNAAIVTLLVIRRQPRALFERWSKTFGGLGSSPPRLSSQRSPYRVERGASRLVANYRSGWT